MSKPLALERISETVWELPVSYKAGMRVPARIYGTEKLIGEMDDAVFDQVTNVATLPGIVRYCPLHARRPLRLWIPHRRGRGHGRGEGRGDLPRRHRLRHQLRHAARPDQPHL